MPYYYIVLKGDTGMADFLCDSNNKNKIKPFWSWNSNLNPDEIAEQIESLHKVNIGGFFMHARSGLFAEYLGDEWMKCVEKSLDMSKKYGMEAWAYDENGWPSGFADGVVPSMGDDYCQKWLEIGIYDSKNPVQYPIAYYEINECGFKQILQPFDGCTVIGYGLNRYYIDTFFSPATDAFIENTHEKYYKKFGNRFGNDLKGFFTDEPQFCNNGCAPWSPVFIYEFESRFGYSLIEKLPLLYYEFEGFEAFRFDFYNMAANIFRVNFIKKMYDWCENHNCKLTGHMMAEDSLSLQMRCTLGVMPCYEYFHEPGIDWLGRMVTNDLLPKQLASVAAQLGKKTLVEIFALCGWDVSLNELKWVAQWQMVNGVTSLCPHMFPYSIEGSRKRDYPPSFFTQSPWYEEGFPIFNDYITRVGALLDDGTDSVPMLMIHPLQTAYIKYNPINNNELYKYDQYFTSVVEKLSGYHIAHHYGDETIIEHYGSVENGALRVGKCRYEAVLLPCLDCITENTANLLIEFVNQGGKAFALDRKPSLIDGRKIGLLKELNEKITLIDDVLSISELLPAEDLVSIRTEICENTNIKFTRRIMPDGKVLYYFVNLSEEPQTVKITINGSYNVKEFDVLKSKYKALQYSNARGKTEIRYDFDSYSSLILKCDTDITQQLSAGDKTEYLSLNNQFEIKECSENTITLDYCSFKIDNGDWQAKMPVILLQDKLLKLGKPCNFAIKFDFFVKSDDAKNKIWLCIERPENYNIFVNGNLVEYIGNDYYIDKSIMKTDISKLVTSGNNEIVIDGKFSQSDNVYKVLNTPNIHESETNKLTFNTELESIYLVGDFGVEMSDKWHLGERKCLHAGRNFSLVNRRKTVTVDNITSQDFWFFRGNMLLTQEITVNKSANVRYILKLKKLFAPTAKLLINGKEAGTFAFSPYEIDVTDYLRNGKNEVAIRLFSGNRNIFGPHHRPIGESHFVSPATFTDKIDWTDKPTDSFWTDNYNFVLFGMQF